MIFRLADEKDAIELAELGWERKAEQKPLDEGKKEEFIKRCSEYIKDLFRENYNCWVAEDNGAIISHIYVITIKKVPTPDNFDRRWGYVTTARTVPEHRDKGVGSALMDRVKEWARLQGLTHLTVHPSERSVPFYERAGFKNVDDVYKLHFK